MQQRVFHQPHTKSEAEAKTDTAVIALVGRDSGTEQFVSRIAADQGRPFRCLTDISMFRNLSLQAPCCVIFEHIFWDDVRTVRWNVRYASISPILLAVQPKVRDVVSAMRNGATCVLDWPSDAEQLDGALRVGLSESQQRTQTAVERHQALARFDSLTPQEMEALHLIVAGKSNKQVAVQLQTSLRTAERRRSNIFSKVRVESAIELSHVYQTAFPYRQSELRVHRPNPGAPKQAPNNSMIR